MMYCIKYYCCSNDNSNDSCNTKNRCAKYSFSCITLLLVIIVTSMITCLISYGTGLLLQGIIFDQIDYDIFFSATIGCFALITILIIISVLAGLIFALGYYIINFISCCYNIYQDSEEHRQKERLIDIRAASPRFQV